MPNCVKNVRNQRLNNSLISGYINTVFREWLNKINNCSQTNFIIQLSTTSTTLLSTTKNYYLYLLNNSFTHNPQYLLMSLLKRI